MSQPILNRNWNERYLNGDTPWVTHTFLTQIVEDIQSLLPKSASILEVGCGYGQEAIALAKLGFTVTGIDLSEAAIQQAQKNALQEKVNIHFVTHDLLRDPNHFKPVDLVFDIAVLHTFDQSNIRCQFAQAVAGLLKPNGLWVNMSCVNPDVLKVQEITGIKAPPALTQEMLTEAYQQNFALMQQEMTYYEITREGQKQAAFPASISILKKKEEIKTKI